MPNFTKSYHRLHYEVINSELSVFTHQIYILYDLFEEKHYVDLV